MVHKIECNGQQKPDTFFFGRIVFPVLSHIPQIIVRNEDLIISESMAQNFCFTDVLGKQAHSRLRNCFYSASVEPKDKSDSGIIQFSLVSDTLSISGRNQPYLLHQFYWINQPDSDALPAH